MATLQKLRDKGSKLLIAFVGVALFAFVAGDIVKLFQKTGNETVTVGSINGKAISYEEFVQTREYCEAYYTAIYGNRDGINQEYITQMAWEVLVRKHVMADKAKEIGLTIDKEEYNQYFINNENKMIPAIFLVDGKFNSETYNYLENIVSAYAGYEQQLAPADLEQLNGIKTSISAMPFVLTVTPINFTEKKLMENGVNTTELMSSIKPNETYDVVYVIKEVKPGKSELEDINAEFTQYAESLKNKSESIEEIAFSASSEVGYDSFLWTETSNRYGEYTEEIKKYNEGEVSEPYANWDYNTFNLVYVAKKAMVPEKIKFRYITVESLSVDTVNITTDKLLAELNKNADFETIAKDYPSDTIEFNTSNFNEAFFGYNPANGKPFITAEIQNKIYSAKRNAYEVLELTPNTKLIMQVMEREGEVAAYNAFIIQRPIPVYNDTYDNAYSDLNQLVIDSNNVEELLNNAGDDAVECTLNENSVNINGIPGTRELLGWVLSGNKGKISDILDIKIGFKQFFIVVGVKDVKHAEQKSNTVNRVYEYM